METTEKQRFEEYVRKTSRLDAIEQRLRLFPALDGRTCNTAHQLAQTVGGNSHLRLWIGRAIRDGEIVRDEYRRLGVPSTRDLQLSRAERARDALMQITCIAAQHTQDLDPPEDAPWFEHLVRLIDNLCQEEWQKNEPDAL